MAHGTRDYFVRTQVGTQDVNVTVDGEMIVVQSKSETRNINEVTIGSTATKIVDANSSRKAIIIQNVGNTEVYLGDSGVTTSDGIKLEPGSLYSNDSFTGAIYGIVSSGSSTVRYEEDV